MGCRGVHLALNAGQEQRLLAAGTDEARMAVLEEIENVDPWEEPGDFGTDKAWDALHRCLADGTLTCDEEGGAEDYPLSHAVLGGRFLLDGDDYIIAYVSADQVKDVAEALSRIDESRLRQRYLALDFPDYQGVKGEDDFEYAWANFRGLPEFFAGAAALGKSVIFTVDQ